MITPQTRAAAQLRAALTQLACDAGAALHIYENSQNQEQLGMILKDAAYDLQNAAILLAVSMEQVQ